MKFRNFIRSFFGNPELELCHAKITYLQAKKIIEAQIEAGYIKKKDKERSIDLISKWFDIWVMK